MVSSFPQIVAALVTLKSCLSFIVKSELFQFVLLRRTNVSLLLKSKLLKEIYSFISHLW